VLATKKRKHIQASTPSVADEASMCLHRI